MRKKDIKELLATKNKEVINDYIQNYYSPKLVFDIVSYYLYRNTNRRTYIEESKETLSYIAQIMSRHIRKCNSPHKLLEHQIFPNHKIKYGDVMGKISNGMLLLGNKEGIEIIAAYDELMIKSGKKYQYDKYLLIFNILNDNENYQQIKLLLSNPKVKNRLNCELKVWQNNLYTTHEEAFDIYLSYNLPVNLEQCLKSSLHKNNLSSQLEDKYPKKLINYILNDSQNIEQFNKKIFNRKENQWLESVLTSNQSSKLMDYIIRKIKKKTKNKSIDFSEIIAKDIFYTNERYYFFNPIYQATLELLEDNHMLDTYHCFYYFLEASQGKYFEQKLYNYGNHMRQKITSLLCLLPEDNIDNVIQYVEQLKIPKEIVQQTHELKKFVMQHPIIKRHIINKKLQKNIKSTQTHNTIRKNKIF